MGFWYLAGEIGKSTSPSFLGVQVLLSEVVSQLWSVVIYSLVLGCNCPRLGKHPSIDTEVYDEAEIINV